MYVIISLSCGRSGHRNNGLKYMGVAHLHLSVSCLPCIRCHPFLVDVELTFLMTAGKDKKEKKEKIAEVAVEGTAPVAAAVEEVDNYDDLVKRVR